MRFQTASVRHHASRSARTAATAVAFAAAVALLALLPVFGQSTFDHTDGEIRSGSLSVGVFADIADAKLAKNVMTVFRDGTVVYVPQASPTPIESSNTLSADQTAYLADGRVSPRDTFFGDTLFVSNDPEAYNTLLIMAEQSAVQENTDGCVEATVRNGRSGAAITVQMAVTAATGGTVYYQGFVRVLDSRAEDEAGAPLYASSNGPSCVEPTDPADTTPNYTDGVGQNDTASVLARHDDIVTLSVRGAGILSVRVDGEGPELIGVTPEDLGYYRSRDLEYAFTVRDGDAGLRHDGELVITRDGDYTQVNADGDHATSGEPLTTASGGQVSVNGNAADIDVLVWARDAHVDTARDITHTGNWMPVGSRPGVEYAFAADGSGTDEGIRYMEITARDRAGNRTVSDALDDDDGQPHLFTVDDTEPQPNQAWTGISYDPEFMQGGRETANRSWIMVGFGEALGGDIKPELIRVSDHEVVGVLHPAWGPPPDRTVLGRADGSAPAEGERPIDIFGDLIPDARSRIYVELARQLGADETPEVLFFGGGVRDLAGNANDSENVRTRDGIAPHLAMTVTAINPSEIPASAEARGTGRPVANTRGGFVVDVRADEDLRRRPEVYFAGIGAVREAWKGGGTLPAQEDAQHWRRTYEVSNLDGLDELFGLLVFGFDDEGNVGETSTLLEIDRGFNGGIDPEHALIPSGRRTEDETESANPFIRIGFPAEANEYAACLGGSCGGGFSDSHARVRITAITLDGQDARDDLVRFTAGQFTLVARGLELGDHEVAYTAVDDAGNAYTGEFTFSVVERAPYELEVKPGWNLISFPGTPADPSPGGVVPSGARVSPLLAYQDGDWLTAVVDEEGRWAGNLTRFEAGFGYWVFAETFATLAPVIPAPNPTETPPTVPVRHGWNLLGVLDVCQDPAGTPPCLDDGGEADTYFRSIPWRIAYTYDTTYSRWVRSVPGADRAAPRGTSADDPGFRLVGEGDGASVVIQEVLNGKGYWVWSAEPGTLVP